MSGSESSAHGASPEAVRLTVYPLDGSALPRSDPQVRSGRLKMLLVLLVCAAPVVASYLMYFVVRPDARSNHGSLITPTRAMPALGLSSLDAKPVSPASLRGQWLLIVVAPAACPAACERLLHAQRQLREMLGRERERLDKIWLITDHASPSAALRDAISAVPAVQALRVDARALAAWLQPAPGQALEDHLYLVDPLGEWMMRFPARIEPARIKRDLDRVLRASASWDRPGRER